MTSDWHLSAGAQPAPAAALYLLLALLSAWTALAMVRHAHDLSPTLRRRWLLATSAGLGSVAWAVPLLAMAFRGAPDQSALGWPAMTVGWLAAAVTAGAGLFTAVRLPKKAARLFGGALLMALVAPAASWLTLVALGAQASPADSPLAQPTATVSWAAGLVMACFVLLGQGALLVHRRLLTRRAGSLQAQHAEFARDPLTGLPSRQSFEGTLAQATRLADARAGRLALLNVAMDGMGSVNQAYGHHGGDEVLQEIAKRLRRIAKPHMVARLHSDEFLLLITEDPAGDDAAAVANQVLRMLGKPIMVAGQDVELSCSIGVALYPSDAQPSQLIAHAGMAMRAAKRAGGAAHAPFDARLAHDDRDRSELLKDLRNALPRKQFELVYQPKVHAPSGQITGAEALLRWNHPSRGVIAPDRFIALAEQSGLICSIGDWVIEQACAQARLWRDQGLRMRVAINLSPVQLRQPDLVSRLAATLALYGIQPALLTCEITESVALEDTPTSRQFFSDLAQLGVHISIDDFGSGYANLAGLRKLPAGELKIDRSFVVDLTTHEEARRVVRAVVGLAKALGRQVVAEGVETEAQFQVLRELGCDQVQGFYFAKPMTARALQSWAMDDVGPRSIQFRASLFTDTRLAEHT
jgi:diguanylate cyclase (GGDEF)-like protein